MKTIVFFLLLTKFFQSGSPNKEIQKEILGKWSYQYSLLSNVPTKLKVQTHCPVETMIFRPCSDKNELKRMPKTVRDQRLHSMLKNVLYEAYNNGKKIDRYFPIEKKLIVKSDTIYFVTNYGLKFKSEYFIKQVNADTLIIYDEKNYNVGGKEYSAVRHVYIRVNNVKQVRS